MSFSKIQNPNTGKWVNINGRIGKTVLNNYIKQFGGALITDQPNSRFTEYGERPTLAIPPPGKDNSDEEYSKFINLLSDLNYNVEEFIKPISKEEYIDIEDSFTEYMINNNLDDSSIEDIFTRIRDLLTNIIRITIDSDIQIIEAILESPNKYDKMSQTDRTILEQFKNNRNDNYCGIYSGIYASVLDYILKNKPNLFHRIVRCCKMKFKDAIFQTLYEIELMYKQPNYVEERLIRTIRNKI